MERFGHIVMHYPELGGFGFAVYEIYSDKPVLRILSGCHYGTEQLAELAGQRVWARVMRVAERHSGEMVAA